MNSGAKHIKTGFTLFVCMLLFGCLLFFLATILFKFWSPFLLIIPKIPSHILDALVRIFSVLALTILLCYVLGLIFGSKIRRKIPLFKEMDDLSHRPLVLVEVFPGIKMIGIITGKQKGVFDGTDKCEVRPRVYIPHSPNPTSGFLTFPEKGKVLLVKAPTSSMLQMLISMGILGSGIIHLENDGPDLNSYYV